MSKNLFSLIAPAALAIFIPAAVTFAAPMSLTTSNPGLDGTTDTDLWHTLNASTVPGSGSFPGNTMWNPVNSQTANSGTLGDASLVKVRNGTGGGPYGASGSMYFGGFSGDPNIDGGSLKVVDSTPLAGVKTVAFQIQIGEATTYDFFNHVLPTLKYFTATNTTGSTIAAPSENATSEFLEQFDNGTVEMPTGTETIYINTYLLTYDLSEVTEPITKFEVEFTGVQHAQLYQVRLDQSDVAAVPEPASIGLLGLAGLVALRRSRRIA